MRKMLIVVGGAVAGFVGTFALIFVLAWTSWHRAECSGEECLGYYVLSTWFALVGGLAVGIGAGVLIWLVLAWRAEPSTADELAERGEAASTSTPRAG